MTPKILSEAEVEPMRVRSELWVHHLIDSHEALRAQHDALVAAAQSIVAQLGRGGSLEEFLHQLHSACLRLRDALAALEQSKGGESVEQGLALHPDAVGLGSKPSADRSPSSSDVFADCRKCNCRYDRLLVHICLADPPSSEECQQHEWVHRWTISMPSIASIICLHCGTGKAKP